MKVFDLRCSHDHGFEGWFASEDDFQGQCARGLVTCPVCGAAQVDKVPSATRLNLGASTPRSSHAATSASTSPHAPSLPAGRAVAPALFGTNAAPLWQALREAVRSAEDVGSRFAQEARRIHEGDAPDRGIRGQVSAQETRELLEEGILVLPVPPSLKETLQ